MISLCKIDGTSFDAIITAIQEKTEILEGANSGVAISKDREIRDITGIKIGHAITFDPDADPVLFDDLYDYLFGSIKQSVFIEAVHNQKTITYEAAYNTCDRSVSHIDEDNEVIYWGELTVEFRPIENQINPE
jgi:hypothetical protein